MKGHLNLGDYFNAEFQSALNGLYGIRDPRVFDNQGNPLMDEPFRMLSANNRNTQGRQFIGLRAQVTLFFVVHGHGGAHLVE
ncbi:hypothetical protein D3C73_1377990 [compost metagenome]